MELVCVRHGRTAWNEAKRFQGRTDVPLDAEGEAQALALAAHLRHERFDVALASNLTRARMTARAIAAACGIAIESEPRLREMGFGEWEGLTWDEIVVRHPELAAASPTSPRVYVPQGGESFDAVCARVRPVVAEVTARLRPDGRALIVSHAGVMHAILRETLAGTDGAALGVKLLPASILRLRGTGAIPWTLAAVNEIAPPLADSATIAP
jgi:probable phosphoglycerate mutase